MCFIFLYIYIALTILNIFHFPVIYLQLKTVTSAVYWAKLSKFHLKAMTESSL
jgi:hypothetical protein